MADRHGYLFFDTGVLYRALALKAIEKNVDPKDEEALANIASSMKVSVLPSPATSHSMYKVIVDGSDVTDRLRSSEVENIVSIVSAHPKVRQSLLEHQRRIAKSGPSVVVGRDIGTVVLPDAQLKIYLDATPEERANRRYRELLSRGVNTTYEQVLTDIHRRDKLDSSRAASPLRVPKDAVVIDTTGKNIQEVLAEVEHWM